MGDNYQKLHDSLKVSCDKAVTAEKKKDFETAKKYYSEAKKDLNQLISRERSSDYKNFYLGWKAKIIEKMKKIKKEQERIAAEAKKAAEALKAAEAKMKAEAAEAKKAVEEKKAADEKAAEEKKVAETGQGASLAKPKVIGTPEEKKQEAASPLQPQPSSQSAPPKQPASQPLQPKVPPAKVTPPKPNPHEEEKVIDDSDSIASGKHENANSNSNDNDNAADEQLRSQLASAFQMSENQKVKWDDIAGQDEAKGEMRKAIILPQKQPHLYQSGQLKHISGILLYGPPGTGKSYLARACATECDSDFASITSSDLISKFHGDSQRLVRTLFTMAREFEKKSIIFIDEIDSIACKRTEGDDATLRAVKNELMAQMDGVKSTPEKVIVIAATNTPESLDEAILRRFQKQIEVGLPDMKVRRKMFELHTSNTPNLLQEKDFDNLAEASEGLSAADIMIVAQDAGSSQLSKAMDATHFYKDLDGKYICCPPTHEKARKMSFVQVPNGKLKIHKVSFDDYWKALMQKKANQKQIKSRKEQEPPMKQDEEMMMAPVMEQNLLMMRD